jgi:tyrosyl-tRNA synthetase
MVFDNYEQLEKDFADKKVHPGDLKAGVIAAINELLDPIRKVFDQPEFKKLEQLAYPPPEPVKKVNPKLEKKEKKKAERAAALAAKAAAAAAEGEAPAEEKKEEA